MAKRKVARYPLPASEVPETQSAQGTFLQSHSMLGTPAGGLSEFPGASRLSTGHAIARSFFLPYFA